jgi:hypothetical protein
MIALIENEIEHLIELEKILETNDRQRMEYKLYAAVIPCQEASDHCESFPECLDLQGQRTGPWRTIGGGASFFRRGAVQLPPRLENVVTPPE